MDPTPNQYPTDNGRNEPHTPPCARAPRYRLPIPLPKGRQPPTKTYRTKTTVPSPSPIPTPNTPTAPTLTPAHLDAIAAATELGMRPAVAKQFALEVLTVLNTGLILRHILNRRIQPK